ncbi:MAG: AAA family ATPase [Candidatus Dormibacteria bacterium]
MPTVSDLFDRVLANVGRVVVGKDHEVRLCLVALLCRGHLLIEDVPGVGKTMVAKALARSLGCTFRRVQFTPDLLPSDLTGVNAFNQKLGDFVFRPGPVFAQVVLADEINRATPRTQAALLEAMEERQATIDGETHRLPDPFLVMATENPVEYAGTFDLPEAELDRFLMRMHLGYLHAEEEAGLLLRRAAPDPDQLEPVLGQTELQAAFEAVREVHVEPSLARYVVDLARATREHPDLALGASTRASLALLHASQAYSASRGRDYVLPDDIKLLCRPVWEHRLQLRPAAQMRGSGPGEILDLVLEQVPGPRLESPAPEARLRRVR